MLPLAEGRRLDRQCGKDCVLLGVDFVPQAIAADDGDIKIGNADGGAKGVCFFFSVYFVETDDDVIVGGFAGFLNARTQICSRGLDSLLFCFGVCTMHGASGREPFCIP